MNQYKTPHPYVFKFDNILNLKECSYIEDYVKNYIPSYNNINKFLKPWDDKQNIPYSLVKDDTIKIIMNCFRFLTSQFISHLYNQFTYPQFTDLVLWQKGRSFDYHIDNQSPGFENRSFFSVLYINDNYKGGETIIKGYNGSPDYISQPKKGSSVVFTSDEKCMYKVNEIIEGDRITLISWFTLNKQDIEI
jgi:predicted 2-oxoglutarate/Fe(II)-dependent dioxygenase YbiX